jgi:hypothetical protein
VLAFLTDVLATYRLTRLITRDTITEDLRYAVTDAALTKHSRVPLKAAELVGCPWCVSVYVAALVVAARTFIPRLWRPVALGLALSTAAGFLSTVDHPS